MTKCAICGHARHQRTGEKLVRLPGILKALCIEGESAHATCAVDARRKQEAKDMRRAIPPRFRGTDFKNGRSSRR